MVILATPGGPMKFLHLACAILFLFTSNLWDKAQIPL